MRRFAVLLLVVAAEFGVAAGAHAASNISPHTKSQNKPAAQTQTQPQPQKYTVVSGDSLSSIAAANNLPSWMPLWDVNTNLQNPDQIVPGEQLIIPAAPYPATDRALPAGYDAPVVTASAPASAAPVSTVAASVAVVGSPGGLAQRVCSRESGCNYAENTGNGYYGAYQFDAGTWADYDGYAEANLAPPAVQDAKFQREYAVRGCSPWPNTCY